MKRNRFKKVMDSVTYNKKNYKDFINKTNITPYKFLFTQKYYDIISSFSDGFDIYCITNLMNYSETDVLRLFDFVINNKKFKYLEYKDYSLLLNDNLVKIFDLDKVYINENEIKEICDLNLQNEYNRLKNSLSTKQLLVLSVLFNKNIIELLPNSESITLLSKKDEDIINRLSKLNNSKKLIERCVLDYGFRDICSTINNDVLSKIFSIYGEDVELPILFSKGKNISEHMKNPHLVEELKPESADKSPVQRRN